MSGHNMSAERLGELAMLAGNCSMVFLSLLAAEMFEGVDVEVVVVVSSVLKLKPRLDPVAAAHLSRSGLE